MNRKKLEHKADLWLALQGAKDFDALLKVKNRDEVTCKKMCKYHSRCQDGDGMMALRHQFSYKSGCIKWLDDEK